MREVPEGTVEVGGKNFFCEQYSQRIKDKSEEVMLIIITIRNEVNMISQLLLAFNFCE